MKKEYIIILSYTRKNKGVVKTTPLFFLVY